MNEKTSGGSFPDKISPLNPTRSTNVVADETVISLEKRAERNKHKPFVFWMTGLSGSGKSTIGALIEHALFGANYSVVRLDGDNLRHGLCGDLGFNENDRHENLRRAGHVARLLYDYGHIVLCTYISPFQFDRNLIRSLFAPGEFVEVFIKCPIETCENRDPKGLYKKARSGQLKNMTGIDSPYEQPENPDLILPTSEESATALAKIATDFIVERVSFP